MAFSKGVVLLGLMASSADGKRDLSVVSSNAAAKQHRASALAQVSEKRQQRQTRLRDDQVDTRACGEKVQAEMQALFAKKDMDIANIHVQLNVVRKSIDDKLEMLQRTIDEKNLDAKQMGDMVESAPAAAAELSDESIGAEALKGCNAVFKADCVASQCGNDIDDDQEDLWDENWDIEFTSEAPMPALLKDFDLGGATVDKVNVLQVCKATLEVPEDDDEGEYMLCTNFCEAFAKEVKSKESFTNAGTALAEVNKDVAIDVVKKTQTEYDTCLNYKQVDLKRVEKSVNEAVGEITSLKGTKENMVKDVSSAFVKVDDLRVKFEASQQTQKNAQAAFEKNDKAHDKVLTELQGVQARMQDVETTIQDTVDLLKNIGETGSNVEDATVAAEEIKMKLVMEIQTVIDATNQAIRDPIKALLDGIPTDAFDTVESLAQHENLLNTATELVTTCAASKADFNLTDTIDAQVKEIYASGEESANSKALCPWHGDKARMTQDLATIVTDITDLQSGSHTPPVTPKALLDYLKTALEGHLFDADDWYAESNAMKGGGSFTNETTGSEFEGACEDDEDFVDAQGRSCEAIHLDSDPGLCADGEPLEEYNPVDDAVAGRHAGQACCACGGGTQLKEAGELGLLRMFTSKFLSLPIYDEYFSFWAVQGGHKKYFALMLEQLNLAKLHLEDKSTVLQKKKQELDDIITDLNAKVDKLSVTVHDASKKKSLSQEGLTAADTALKDAKTLLEEAKSTHKTLNASLQGLIDSMAAEKVRLTKEIKTAMSTLQAVDQKAAAYVEPYVEPTLW